MTPAIHNPQATMSSLEIARLTGKDHKNVIADIRKTLEEMGEGGELKFQSSYKTSQNKELPCFNLPRRECDILISGYSIPYRVKIIDQWRELEATSQLPKTFSEALRLAADLQDKLTEKTQKLIEKTEQLDESMEWYSVKRVAIRNGKTSKEYSWLPLKRQSFLLDKPPRKAFDANYGEVNVYHIDAWMEVYPDDMFVMQTEA